MEKPFIVLDAKYAEISAFDVKPIDGFVLPCNPDTGEKFPFCCKNHKKQFQDLSNWFESFPDCCTYHKTLKENVFFEKEKYKYVITKVLKQVSYTVHFISNRIDNNDWYEDIIEYIEYNVSSFGHPNVGYDKYITGIASMIQDPIYKLNISKCKKIFDYLNGYFNPCSSKSTDINILFSIYQKWLKTFPFELNSYFAKLKAHFQNQFPLFSSKPIVNRYSGIAKAPMHTKESLIEFLCKQTENLLSIINGPFLLEKGLIKDINKVKLELIIAQRKMKIQEGYCNKSTDESTRYRKTLKQWLNDEKKFFNEITPIIEKNQQLYLPINNNSMDYNPHSFDSVVNFYVDRVNPGDKMKTYISCFGHFDDLKQHFDTVCLDLQLAIINIPPADRYSYINTYNKKTQNLFNNFSSFPRNIALDFLQKANKSLVDFFNMESHQLTGESHELPRALKHSWDDYEHMHVGNEVRDTHQSLISVISDHFKEEFLKFLESIALSYLPDSSSSVQKKELKKDQKQKSNKKEKDLSDTKEFPTELKHIFVSEEVMKDALKVLAVVEPPILNEECDRLLNNKTGALGLWVDSLVNNKLIHKKYTAKKISELLAAHLSEDFSVSAAWKNTTGKQWELYRPLIIMKLAEVRKNHKL